MCKISLILVRAGCGKESPGLMEAAWSSGAELLGERNLHVQAVLFLMLQNCLPDGMVVNSPWERWEELVTMLVALQMHQEINISWRQDCPHNTLQS